MKTIDRNTPGSFSWVELATTDQQAAKNFYSSLFGWKVNDFPMGQEDVYTIFSLRERNVSAAYTMKKEERSQGAPPHWNIYIEVESADAAAKQASAVGGKILAEPFDVFDKGRMAIIQDPTGAMFSIWQSKSESGIGISEIDGTFCWADLSTPDPARAQKFYSDLFGWQIVKDSHDPSSDYLHIVNGKESIGGIQSVAQRDPSMPPHWLIYFLTSNCDATAAKAKQLQAKFHVEPFTMEHVGRMAFMADPQGANFAIYQPGR